METIIVIILAALVGFGSAKILKKDDNIIEETMEEIIKIKTGVDIDLTPDSPENVPSCNDKKIEHSNCNKPS